MKNEVIPGFLFRVKIVRLWVKLFSFYILQMSFLTVKQFCWQTKEIFLISMDVFWKERNFTINRICLRVKPYLPTIYKYFKMQIDKQ